MRSLSYLGLTLEPSTNEADPVDADIAMRDSGVPVLVITAREDLSILREVKSVLQWD